MLNAPKTLMETMSKRLGRRGFAIDAKYASLSFIFVLHRAEDSQNPLRCLSRPMGSQETLARVKHSRKEDQPPSRGHLRFSQIGRQILTCPSFLASVSVSIAHKPNKWHQMNRAPIQFHGELQIVSMPLAFYWPTHPELTSINSDFGRNWTRNQNPRAPIGQRLPRLILPNTWRS